MVEKSEVTLSLLRCRDGNPKEAPAPCAPDSFQRALLTNAGLASIQAPFLNAPLEGAIDRDEALLTLRKTDLLPNTLAGYHRNARQAEEILTSDYQRLLGQLPAKRNAESFIGKGDSDNISEDKVTTKRHADAMFTDRMDLIERQKALRPLWENIRHARNEPETYRNLNRKRIYANNPQRIYEEK